MTRVVGYPRLAMPLFIDLLLAIAMLDAVYARSLPCIFDMGLQQLVM